MERIQEVILIVGIILLSAYSIKTTRDCAIEIEKITQDVQMMFIKS